MEHQPRARLDPATKAVLEEWLGTRAGILEAIKDGAIDTYAPMPHQITFHRSMATNRWFVGANRTGKTFLCLQEVKWFALGKHPYRDLEGPARLIWVCAPTSELSKLYHQPVLEELLRDEILTFNQGSLPMMVLKNGCRIVFKFYAQGAKAFPSGGADLVFCDEEPEWPVFEEIWFRRAAGRELNIIGANTMVKGFTWMFDKIIKHGLPDTEWFTANLDSNRFLSESERKKIRDGAKQSETMYRIRVKGEILPIGGALRFHEGELTRMFEQAKPPAVAYRFDLDDERWVQEETGQFLIWEAPVEGEEYVIGGDVAEGLNVSYSEMDPLWDETSLQVLRRSTGKFVAEWTAGNIEPGIVGDKILPRIHKFYNHAHCNIELNLHGFTVVSHARHAMDPGALWSPVKDDAAWAEAPLRQLGTLMSDRSRNRSIDTMAQAICERQVEIVSGQAVHQCLQFVTKPNGRAEHRDGAKDDRVFAMAHALECDRHLPPPVIKRPPTVREQLRAFAMADEKRSKKRSYFKELG